MNDVMSAQYLLVKSNHENMITTSPVQCSSRPTNQTQGDRPKCVVYLCRYTDVTVADNSVTDSSA